MEHNVLKKELLSKQERLHRKNKYIRRLVLIYMLCSFLVLVLIILFFQIPFLKIKHIHVQGVTTMRIDEIQGETQKYLSEKKFFFFPRSNIFLMNKNTLSNKLKSQFPNIDTLSIEKEFTSLTLILTEREPRVLWCRDISDETSCYLVHRDGVIYQKSGVTSTPLYFVYNTYIAQDDPISEMVSNFENYQRVEEIRTLFKKYKIELYGYVLLENGEEYFVLSKLVWGQNIHTVSKLLTSTDQDATTIVSKVLTALKSEGLKEHIKSDFENLLYIDARFNNQVSFKVH